MAEEDRYDGTVEIHTLLGKGTQFEGKLTFEGTVRIDGEFIGQIFSDDILVVGEGARVNADLEVGSLVVEGTVEGNIVANDSVEIHSPGRVNGNITTPSLFIDRGVVFEGNCTMGTPTADGEDTLHITAALPDEQRGGTGDATPGIGNVERSGTIDSGIHD